MDVIQKVWDHQNDIKINNEKFMLQKLNQKIGPSSINSNINIKSKIFKFSPNVKHGFINSGLMANQSQPNNNNINNKNLKLKKLDRVLFVLDDVLGDKSISNF